MSLLEFTYFVLLYSFHNICTGGLSLEDEHKRLARENFQGDLQTQQSTNLNAWPATNQSFPTYQNNNILKQGWKEVKNWPKDAFPLGQVSGVSLASNGAVYVFHRGDRQWGSETFDSRNKITESERSRGPISMPTVIIYDPITGGILQKWGENMFYLPHGITVDRDDNVWMTDVGLHQIFKYPPLKNKPGTAELTLGEAFIPGNDAAHFCKPTSIAITPWGDFFVADGYCNSRIIKYDKDGVKISEWGRSNFNRGIGHSADYMFAIPHALTLAEDKELVCAADRENGRVQCFNWHNGTLIAKIYSSHIGSRLFSVTYSPVKGGLFFVVNGQEMKQFPVSIGGCVLNEQNKELFEFGTNKLQNPHDIAVSSDGKTIYVVEIGPFKIWKFESNDLFKKFVVENNISSPISVSPSKEILSKVQSSHLSSTVSVGGILPAVLVTSAALLFAGALLIAALIYSRAKRRGRSLAEDNFYLETKKLVTSEY